ncbi:hypothetical protein V5O48_013017 [Marasmius crinis-equi]|uniref:F-box domain-containing protein n=1 Tax=Marasmius crinis-equi TaxID=585013 RepID=A0ABR3F1J5_9AGAR
MTLRPATFYSPTTEKSLRGRKTPEFTSDSDSDDDAPLRLHVARIQKRKRRLQAILSSDSEQEDVENPPTMTKIPRKKKQKVATGDSGRPVFLDLPIDVFLEISRRLDPYDLLCLARTNKALREMLMSRKYSNMWRASRANIEGLPPLPPDMTEPAYANLIFNTSCFMCSKRSSSAMWECRIRCCNKCLPELFIDGDVLQANEKYRMLALNAELLALIPKRGQAYFLRSAVEKFTRELEEIKDDLEQVHLWYDTKHKEQAAIKKHAGKCHEWMKMQRDKRKLELAAMRNRRFQRAKELLVAEGWHEPVVDDKRLLGHTFFRENREFSHSAWSRSKPSVVTFLNDIKQEVEKNLERRRGRYSALREFYTKLQNDNPYAILPSLGDLVLTHQIRTLIDHTPLTKELTADDFSTFVSMKSFVFSRLAQQWRSAKETEILEILREAVPTAEKSSSLHLATTVFRCNAVDCGQVLFYPDVLVHPCASSPAFQPATTTVPTKESCPPFISPDACKMVESDPWNAGKNRISFDHEASANARAIVEACGLDPAVATANDMALKNPCIECITCRVSDSEYAVPRLRWPQVLSHLPREKFVVHQPEDAVQDPPEVSSPSTDLPERSWVFGVRCARCDLLSNPRSELFAEHLAKEHGLDRISRNDWYFDTTGNHWPSFAEDWPIGAFDTFWGGT